MKDRRRLTLVGDRSVRSALLAAGVRGSDVKVTLRYDQRRQNRRPVSRHLDAHIFLRDARELPEKPGIWEAKGILAFAANPNRLRKFQIQFDPEKGSICLV